MPQKWQNQNIIIHHDNVQAHRSFKVSQFLAKNNMTVIPIPHTHPIWPPVTFSSSPSWSFGWRVKDSVVSVVQASACNMDTTTTQPHQNSNTHRTKNNTANVVIQQNSHKLLMMGILISETCWAHKKWNKTASDIKLVFYSSTITMMHVPINIRSSKHKICCVFDWHSILHNLNTMGIPYLKMVLFLSNFPLSRIF